MYFSFKSATDFAPIWAYVLGIVSIICLVFWGIIRSYFLTYPPDLPRVREAGRSRFSLKTRLAYYKDCRNLYREAYGQYSKHGKACLLPGLGIREEVILPPSALKWMATQPDTALGVYENFAELDQAEYNLGHEFYVKDPWSGNLVRTQMNRVLESICQGLNDELRYAFDHRFGTDSREWKEIDIRETMKIIIGQASSRFTVGLPLCRNDEYVSLAVRWTELFVLNAGIMGATPPFLRPLVGPFATRQIWRLKNRMQQLFEPIYLERLRTLQHVLKDEKAQNETQDHLDMMLRFAMDERPKELNLHDMTIRVLTSNLGSFHQTTMAVTNLILNLVASDSEYNTIALLREEVHQLLDGDSEGWTKAKVAKMIRMDSVCRETMRLNSFGSRSMLRTVVGDDVRTEDGIHLPKGSFVSILSGEMHQDGDFFENPAKFDPFRFSRVREAEAKEPGSKIENRGTLAFVSTGPQNMPFGHGKHACPGRYLVDFELKMVMAYLVAHYDLELPAEYNGRKPPNKWLAEAMFPPDNARIRIKRRAV